MADLWADMDGDDGTDDVMSVSSSDAEPPPPQPFCLGNDHAMSDEEGDDELEFGENQDDVNPGINAANQVAGQVMPNVLENFFARLVRTLRVPTDVGDSLDPDLAELVNQVFERALPMEEFIRIKETTFRPGNCPQLQVPPVPEAIWVKISGELKGRDKTMQKLHGDFLCFVFKELKCLNKFHEFVPTCPAIEGTVEELAESLRIAGYIHRVGLIEQRRETLNPDLPGEYKRLAGSNFPLCPSSLIGDNLVENVKQISEVTRLLEKMSGAGKSKTSFQQGQRGRYHPYARGRFSNFRCGRQAEASGSQPFS